MATRMPSRDSRHPDSASSRLEIGQYHAGPHLRLAQFPIAEGDGNLSDAERIAAANEDFEGDFEPSRVGWDRGEQLAPYREEAGKGVVDVGQWPGAGRGGAGHEPALARPARCAAAGGVAAADHHVPLAADDRQGEFGNLLRGVRAVGVDDEDSARPRGPRAGQHGAGEAIFRIRAGQQRHRQ